MAVSPVRDGRRATNTFQNCSAHPSVTQALPARLACCCFLFDITEHQFNSLGENTMTPSTNNEQFQTKLHRSAYGFRDYDVIGHPTLRRACVPLNIRRGQNFNIYHGESSKSGAKWLGNLEKSLAAWCAKELQTAPVPALRLRVLLNANGRTSMSCNARLFKHHLVVSGDSGPCCKVEFS